MIEIGAQVDLSHPPDRVWLALTDRELLGRWFAEADVADVPDRLVLHTAGLPGFDANVEVEVTERRVPELLTMRCDEAGRLTEVTCVVTATKQGCRLAIREVTTHGTWSAEQHDPREQQLRQALTVRLPAILDWLAFQQVDLRRGDAGMTAELPTIGALGEGPARARRRRRMVVAVLAGAVLVAGLAAWVILPGEPDSAAAPPPAAPSPAPSSSSVAAVAPTGTPRATPSGRPSRTAASATARPSRTPTAKPSPSLASVPAPPPLTANYRTDSSRLFGYTGEVVVANPGGAPVADWVVVVTLAEGSTFDDVDGADVERDGRTLTFTGSAVPAGGSKTFHFDVRDGRPNAREPEGCTVGGNPCAGV
ncbi:Activator of Hsp90 ATPase homolog 1-like protein [Micromonospora coriariae]|uniref:Activator of Hsp90 ATPase homolog 1-like protein n=1 Tax=Micromonospora coriariae TaxID=285665 RepID=A0A1C4UIY8_9ACTN|nr:cellulose binding domain-containing protein [Micromonospora coriariae]SCE71635.1 Activator of Hsp90 ATPase homolog 1-like protein [Micromonospora coriariae]